MARPAFVRLRHGKQDGVASRNRGKARGLTSLRQGYDLAGRAVAELTAAQSYLEKTFTHGVSLLRFQFAY